MPNTNPRVAQRARRRRRVRKLVQGTSARPRLCVFKSLRYIYAQLIDDDAGTTLTAASSQEKSVADGLASTKDTAAAQKVGAVIAERAKANGIETVVFDRAGYPYHGRVKALADAAREHGLAF
jgi:large subunit ribosomal protein L18